MQARLAIATLLFAWLSQGQGQLPVTVIPAIDEGPTKAGAYDWMGRHNEVVARVKQGDVGLLMIGDSITHGWNEDLWKQYYAPRKAVNLGFGWDGTQHVLWRLQHGEVDGIEPKAAVLLIGTNNIGGSSVEDVAQGISAVVDELQKRLPKTQILVLGVFPRGELPTDPLRGKIKDLNLKISALGKRPNVSFLEIGEAFLAPDGSISKDTMPDFLHLTPAGYRKWVDAMEPTLGRLMAL